jgi:hypothetical protein
MGCPGGWGYVQGTGLYGGAAGLHYHTEYRCVWSMLPRLFLQQLLSQRYLILLNQAGKVTI